MMERKKTAMKRSSRVSYDQLTLLVGYLEQNPDLASGYLNSTAARYKSARMWQEATTYLNAVKGGAAKDPKGWSVYWSDFKNKLKKKKRRNRHMEATGAGPIKPLSDVEERALILLGDKFCGIVPRTNTSEVEGEAVPAQRQSQPVPKPPPETKKSATHRLADAVESIATAAESIANAQQSQAAAMRAAATAVETAATAITRAVRIFETIAGHCGDEPTEDCKPVPFLNLG